jgi:hypothetical protein
MSADTVGVADGAVLERRAHCEQEIMATFDARAFIGLSHAAVTLGWD